MECSYRLFFPFSSNVRNCGIRLWPKVLAILIGSITVPHDFVRVITEEVAAVAAGAAGVFPFGFGRQTVRFAFLLA